MIFGGIEIFRATRFDEKGNPTKLSPYSREEMRTLDPSTAQAYTSFGARLTPDEIEVVQTVNDITTRFTPKKALFAVWDLYRDREITLSSFEQAADVIDTLYGVGYPLPSNRAEPTKEDGDALYWYLMWLDIIDKETYDKIVEKHGCAKCRNLRHPDRLSREELDAKARSAFSIEQIILYAYDLYNGGLVGEFRTDRLRSIHYGMYNYDDLEHNVESMADVELMEAFLHEHGIIDDSEYRDIMAPRHAVED